MKPTRKQTHAWLQTSAEALALRLRNPALSKASRRAARGLLRRAFEALEGDVALDVALDLPPDLALLRAVDAAARPPLRLPIAPPRLGFTPRALAIRPHIVRRLEAHEEMADLYFDRAARFLDFLSQRAINGCLKPPVQGARFGESMTLTEG